MATDFFAAQDAARSRSHRLVALFLASVAGLVAAIYLAITALLRAGGEMHVWWDPDVFLWVAGLTSAVVGVSSLGKVWSLRSGGGTVARSVGGRPLDPAALDPDERRLANVVEEMAIAAGVPVPEIYVLEAEDGINAFAAGFAPRDAAVAVTRGCMKKLNRDELQGVVAHEFSHILNGDMRLNIQLIGLVFGLLVLSIIGQGMLRAALQSGGRRRSGKDGMAIVAAIAAVGLILFVAGWIGVLFGRLLQSAVSRQREFLADAAAVQFTRNPDGLSGALRKIGAAGSRVTNEHSQDVAHLFFANGLKLGWAGLFATHPPLEERIRAIDPSWDGTFGSSPPPLPQNAEPPGGSRMQAATGGLAFTAAAALGAQQLARAQEIHGELSALLGDEWHDPAAARDMVLALLPPVPGEADTSGVQIYREKLAPVEAGRRLALVGMLLPTLARLPEVDRRDLLRQLDLMAGGTTGLDAFEFGIWWIVRRDLRRADPGARRRTKLDRDPAAFAADASVLIASLAHAGGTNNEAARNFESAMAKSPSFGPLCRYPGHWPDVGELDVALQNLGRAAFGLRKEIIEAAARAVTGDNQITDDEAALMQLVSIALDCPAPLPVLAPAGDGEK